MKYFFIAGEPSGDQHAGRLMKALAAGDPGARFSFLGGDRMAETAGKPVVHVERMAFMGFTQVLGNLGKIWRNFRIAKKAVLSFNPDVVILVDYPGFNLRMARWLKMRGFKVYYYIVPAVWAWNTRRVYRLKAWCDKIFPILPFEPEFFNRYGVKSHYAGNPVYEDINRVKQLLQDTKTVNGGQVALLPGSRKQEIERMLPVMLSVVPYFEGYDFVVAAMEVHKDLYNSIILQQSNVRLEYGKTLEILGNSAAALVTSGTATLETALMGVPQLVCYKTNFLSYRIARSLVKVPYISLLNLILGRPAIPELIQGRCNTANLVEGLKKIMPGGPNRAAQLGIPVKVREKLGGTDVSFKLSELIISSLAQNADQEKIF